VSGERPDPQDDRDRRVASTGAVLATLGAGHIVAATSTSAVSGVFSSGAFLVSSIATTGPIGWMVRVPARLEPAVAGGLVAGYLLLIWTTRFGRTWMIVHVAIVATWFGLGWAALRMYLRMRGLP
jgi:hypothetical protein